MADPARTYVRREPRLARWTRLALGPLLVLIVGPLGGLATFRILVETRAARAAAAERWAIGTGLGVAGAGCALVALWQRAARRRHGRARLLPDGASFYGPNALAQARHFAHSELELEEVTEHGVLLVQRGAGRLARWWAPWLVPTADPAEAEGLVAEVSEWTRRAEVAAPLRLRPPARRRLLVLLVMSAWLAGSVAVAVACGGTWTALVFGQGPFLMFVDLLLFVLLPAARVELLPGSIVLRGARRDLAAVALELDADGWLIMREQPRGVRTPVAALGPAGNARLRAELGERLAVVPEPLLRGARRRHLLRALLLAAAGTGLLAWTLRG